MKESGDPIWFAGRLKVENQKITEIEAIVVRPGGGFGNFDRMPDPVWKTDVDPSERSSRETMAKDANKYFDALQDNKAELCSVCGRLRACRERRRHGQQS